MKVEYKVKPRCLMVYLEPTPYIIAFIKKVLKRFKGKLDVLFVGENLSQGWNLPLDDIPAHILPHGLASSICTLYCKITREKYSVIHLAGWGNILLLVALLAAKLHRVPVVVESDTHLAASLPIWKRLLKAIIYPVLFGMPDIMLPAGKRQAEYMRYYGVDEKRIRTLNMTVDVTHIMKLCTGLGELGRRQTRQRLGFTDEDVVFIFVGRLIDRKGIEDLIITFEPLSQNYSNAKLLIVGDGPKKKFVYQSSENNGSIKYLGRLGLEGVIEAYHAADVAVLPSQFEPWGLVVNEAMSAGLPVIASEQVGCVDDLVRQYSTGIVVETGDIQALAYAMEEMLKEPFKRKQMGEKARYLISERTLEKEAERVINIWNEVKK